MAREHFWAYLKDQNGRPLEDAELKLYLADTADEAVIFSTATTASSGSDRIDQSTWTTGASGFFNFYIGNEWETSFGYSASQTFRLKWWADSVTPSAGGEINYLKIFDSVFPVDQTSTNTIKNKMVSNYQALSWTEHLDYTYVDEVHIWEPIDTNDSSNLTENKLVSDDLLFRINRDLDTLLTCGGDAISITASGSLVNVQVIESASWVLSADGSYYSDVSHSIPRNWAYPTYQIYNTDTKDVYWPAKVKDIDAETIRIWSHSNSVNLTMTLVGETGKSAVEVI